jgi:heme-degrading monooxygenase HmoA
MKAKLISVPIILITLLISAVSVAQEKANQRFINPKDEKKMDTTVRKIFIDKFFVPKNAKKEFDNRMKINRNFIRTLAGFIEDNAYQRTDENGDFVIVTVAIWESEDAIKKAKEAVQAEYQRTSFDMPGMLKRLGITIDRGIYEKTGL